MDSKKVVFETDYTAEVVDICERGDGIWTWGVVTTHEYDDGHTEKTRDDYYTNSYGDGIWDSEEDRQLEGTCQFSLSGCSDEKAKKRLDKKFAWDGNEAERMKEEWARYQESES